jgi:hypothetical protein
LPALVAKSKSIQEKIKFSFQQQRQVGEKILAQVFE